MIFFAFKRNINFAALLRAMAFIGSRRSANFLATKRTIKFERVF